jgi:Uma2 family endonuclease
MALERRQSTSVEDYFALEENNPDVRFEYYDGYVYMMAGGTADHATIGFNIQTALRNALRNGPCRVYNSDMRVRISDSRYFHPDVTVTCDPRDRGKASVIQSPRVVVEALSPSTEASDRMRKLHAYLACPTIEEYILVDYRSRRIEVYSKAQRGWNYTVYGTGDEVEVRSLGVRFALDNAYENVVFEEEEEDF